jgi:hypothetical protein
MSRKKRERVLTTPNVMVPKKTQWLTLDASIAGLPETRLTLTALLLASDGRLRLFGPPPPALALSLAVTKADQRDGERFASDACPVARALRRALRGALGGAADRFEVDVFRNEAQIGLPDGRNVWPPPLSWRAPFPQWLTARINAFDRRGEPLTGARCALEFTRVTQKPGP